MRKDTMPRATYEIFYCADHSNVHAVLRNVTAAEAMNQRDAMMADGEAYGLALDIRKVKETEN